MSDTPAFGFGNFVPGFDFLQTLVKGASGGVPGLAGWMTPTMSVPELEKRIDDLKAVQFWLEQNVRAVNATVQALEVQKMTLATLAGMNVAVGDMAAAFGAAGAKAGARPERPSAPVAPAPAPAAPAQAPDASAKPQAASASPAEQGASPAGPADPLQWWGALTNQFQQIATRAMQDAAAHRASFDATRNAASEAFKSASDLATQWAPKVPDAKDAKPRAKGVAAAGGNAPAAGHGAKKSSSRSGTKGSKGSEK